MILSYGQADRKAPAPDPAWWAMFSRLFVRESGDMARVEKVLRESSAPQDPALDDRSEDLLRGFERQGLLRGQGDDLRITDKGRLALQVSILEQVFGSAETSRIPDRASKRASGWGVRESLPWNRSWTFGEDPRDIDWSASLRNVAREGLDHDAIEERHMEGRESESVPTQATVLLIDVSRSMVLYGEDRLTPAKMVAIALSESVRRTPADSLDVLAFGNRARRIPAKSIVELSAEPSHTNTADALRLARETLRGRRASRKRILLLTDGKPTCIMDNSRLLCDPQGRNPRVLERTLAEGTLCARDGCHITTFMLSGEPALVDFVDRFTRAVRGDAFHAGLDRLGEFVLKSW
jgi:Ca-activated chloride channel homolog